VPPALRLLAIGTFTIGTDAFVVAGILPELATDLDVSVAAAGQLVTAYSLAYAVLAPLGASLTGPLCRRTVLVGALAAFAAGNAVSAAADQYAVLLGGRVLAATGAASFTPQASAVAFALVPERLRARALSVIVGGFTVATVLGIPISTLATDAVSIGPYVLSGGELPAMVLVDAIARRLPGALSEGSGERESFSDELDGGLEYPHYTRPAEFRGWAVPDVLLSGDHARIEAWRRDRSRERTERASRP